MKQVVRSTAAVTFRLPWGARFPESAANLLPGLQLRAAAGPGSRTDAANFLAVGERICKRLTVRQQLEQVYQQQRQSLYSLGLAITGCRALAEDAVHDAFLRLCSATVEPSGDLTPYVFAAVRNCAIDAQRRRRRVEAHEHPAPVDSLFDMTPAAAGAAGPPAQVLAAERAEQLARALDTLEQPAREVIVLKIYAGLTFEAIGCILETSAKTVESRYRRALALLDGRLRGQI